MLKQIRVTKHLETNSESEDSNWNRIKNKRVKRKSNTTSYIKNHSILAKDRIKMKVKNSKWKRLLNKFKSLSTFMRMISMIFMICLECSTKEEKSIFHLFRIKLWWNVLKSCSSIYLWRKTMDNMSKMKIVAFVWKLWWSRK